MPTRLDAAEASAKLRSYGHDPSEISPLSGGLWSSAFAFREGGRDLVVRFHERRDDLEKDRYAQRWAGGALRTPRILDIGDHDGGGWAISERVVGPRLDDLDASGFQGILPALFATLDALRAADLNGTTGYGLWHGDGNGERPTWRDTLLGESAATDMRAWRDRIAASPVGASELDAALARMRDLVAFAPEERHLVHNDLLNFNVIAAAEGVVLLDWGASIYGDFVYDAALLTFWWPWYRRRWGAIDIDTEVRRHFAAVPRLAERLRLCELDIGVSHIGFQLEHGRLDDARWTAGRTRELLDAPLSRS